MKEYVEQAKLQLEWEVLKMTPNEINANVGPPLSKLIAL